MARFEEISWRLGDWDLLGTERPMPLMREVLPQLSRSQGRPPGAAPAGLPLDGGKSGGNPSLSADAVAFCLRMLVPLASCG
jgi:hypothetical protein